MASTRAGTRSSESAFPQHSSRRTIRIDAVSKIMRGGKTASARGVVRSATNSKNGNGNDRPEHPLSSISRLAAEEAAAASGGGDALGTAVAARAAGGAGGAGGGHRRMVSDMSSSQRWAGYALLCSGLDCTSPRVAGNFPQNARTCLALTYRDAMHVPCTHVHIGTHASFDNMYLSPNRSEKRV